MNTSRTDSNNRNNSIRPQGEKHSIPGQDSTIAGHRPAPQIPTPSPKQAERWEARSLLENAVMQSNALAQLFFEHIDCHGNSGDEKNMEQWDTIHCGFQSLMWSVRERLNDANDRVFKAFKD